MSEKLFEATLRARLIRLNKELINIEWVASELYYLVRSRLPKIERRFEQDLVDLITSYRWMVPEEVPGQFMAEVASLARQNLKVDLAAPRGWHEIPNLVLMSIPDQVLFREEAVAERELFSF